jgi:hypothetical protein
MLQGWLDRIFYKRLTIDSETFMLWEPCRKSHGEIIPGYASYLLALGYKVVVLMTPARISEGLFSRFSHPRLTLARLSQRRIRRLMRDPMIVKAAGVMISTVGKLSNAPNGRLDLNAVFGEQRPRRLVLVDHDIQARVSAGVWDQNTVTLREIENTPSVVVNPHDFGTVSKHSKSEACTVFVMVGAVRAKRRNQDVVYDALSRLVANGETRFELRLIGKRGRVAIPDLLRPYVIELGYIDYHRLYAEVEAADFIVTSFQRDNPEHLAYRMTKTTGSFQLCYGFATPCILQRDFAAHTALASDNALLYDRDEDMLDALQAAIAMPPDDHAAMVKAMQTRARALYDDSVANLKVLINANNPGGAVL